MGLSLAAGGAGVLAGGVVAYGVGDFAHNMIDENWGADFHQHGVIAGLGYGIGQRRENRPGLREAGYRHRAYGGALVGQHLLSAQPGRR